MNNANSVKIVNRFFEALDTIIAKKVIRGVQTFTRTYNINKRNFYTLRKNPESDIFQVEWLKIMVVDFNVSARWLLTGMGKMFD